MAHYDGYDEIIRVLKAGGVTSPTPEMKRTMTRDYLQVVLLGAKPGTIARGSARIEGYVVSSQTAVEIAFTACENQRDLHFYDSDTGEELPTGESGLLVRELMASKGNDGRWRIAEETEVTRFVDPEDWAKEPCTTEGERPI